MNLKKVSVFLLVIVFGITALFAQTPQQAPQQMQQQQPTEVSENEIEQFALAFREIQVINQQVQQEMIDVVQEEGVDVQRFNEYLTAQQDPAQKINASEEELEQFTSAYQEIEEIQKDATQQMEQAITDNELSVERYQEIAMSIQANPELLQKLQQHFEE
jgi:hypothetical protein